MLLLLIVVLLLLTLIAYTMFDNDILSPPVVVCLGLLFGALCTYYNAETWMIDVSLDTIMVIILGVTFFIIGSVAASLFCRVFIFRNIRPRYKLVTVNQISISNFKVVATIIIQLITVVWIYVAMRQNNSLGLSWAEIALAYRRQAFLAPEDVTQGLPVILRQLIDGCFCVGLYFAYVIGNNIAAKKKISFIVWLPVILSVVISFMQGYRADMLRLWIAILVVCYTQKKRSVGWRSNRETKQVIKKMVYSLLLIAAIFVASRSIVGRQETDWDPLYYVSFYAGSPIAALDLFIKDEAEASMIWGKETFYYLNQSLGSWFGMSELKYRFPKEFRVSPSGIYIGNVYTAFRASLLDFGQGGMLVVMLVMGAFFSFMYYMVHKPSIKGDIDLRLLIYSYIAYTFFMMFYNNYYSFISFNFIKYIIMLLVIRSIMSRTHKKYG